MKKILFIEDNNEYNKFEIQYLKKLNYKVDIANIETIALNKCNDDYNFIIIDLEFNNRCGDITCIKLRKRLTHFVPIIGIYGLNKTGYKNIKNYNIHGFNDLITMPVIDWEKILQVNNFKKILECEDKIYTAWIKKELDCSNYLYKKIFKKNPKRYKSWNLTI